MTTPPPLPRALATVATGGAIGALARWGLGAVAPDADGFPWTTFVVNLVGSVLLAALPALAVVRRRELVSLFLGTGVLGGFTTLSAYSDQTRTLLATGAAGTATVYFLGTLAACWAGVALVRRRVQSR